MKTPSASFPPTLNTGCDDQVFAAFAVFLKYGKLYLLSAAEYISWPLHKCELSHFVRMFPQTHRCNAESSTCKSLWFYLAECQIDFKNAKISLLRWNIFSWTSFGVTFTNTTQALSGCKEWQQKGWNNYQYWHQISIPISISCYKSLCQYQYQY